MATEQYPLVNKYCLTGEGLYFQRYRCAHNHLQRDETAGPLVKMHKCNILFPISMELISHVDTFLCIKNTACRCYEENTTSITVIKNTQKNFIKHCPTFQNYTHINKPGLGLLETERNQSINEQREWLRSSLVRLP